jgi:hypothetical protein
LDLAWNTRNSTKRELDPFEKIHIVLLLSLEQLSGTQLWYYLRGRIFALLARRIKYQSEYSLIFKHDIFINPLAGRYDPTPWASYVHSD